MIVKSGKKWFVKTQDGSKTLGTHSTKRDAVRQLQAIESSKKKEKKRVPHPQGKSKYNV